MHTNFRSRLPAKTRILLGIFLASAMAFFITVPLVRRGGDDTGGMRALFLRDVVPERVREQVITVPVEGRVTSRTSISSVREHMRRHPALSPRRVGERTGVALERRTRVPVEIVSDALRPPMRSAAPVILDIAQDFILDTEPQTPIAAFGKTVFPVSRTPNWGAMRSSAEWDRRFEDMHPSDFVPVPAYEIAKLTEPMHFLSRDLQEVNIPIVTAKLFYATRYFGRYHTDSGEFEGNHPGIDLKLAPGTPIGAIAGGTVHYSGTDPYLGNYVMVEHELPDSGQRVVSIYGHLESSSVREGQKLAPGDTIGLAGSTGRSSGPHLHLQIDYKKEPGRHMPYIPGSGVTAGEASGWTLHPITFIARYRASR